MRACARLLMLNACLTCLQIALLFGYDAHNGPAEPADAGFLVELLPRSTRWRAGAGTTEKRRPSQGHAPRQVSSAATETWVR